MEYHLLSDELLVKLLRVDDQGAFQEIYQRYWKALFSAAQYKLKTDEIAEELLQEVFLSIWKNELPNKLKIWGDIYTSLSNTKLLAIIENNC